MQIGHRRTSCAQIGLAPGLGLNAIPRMSSGRCILSTLGSSSTALAFGLFAGSGAFSRSLKNSGDFPRSSRRSLRPWTFLPDGKDTTLAPLSPGFAGVRGPGPANTGSIAGAGSPTLRVFSMATPPLDKARTPSPCRPPQALPARSSLPSRGGWCYQRGATFPIGRDHTHDNTLPLTAEARKSTDPGLAAICNTWITPSRLREGRALRPGEGLPHIPRSLGAWGQSLFAGSGSLGSEPLRRVRASSQGQSLFAEPEK